MVSNILRSSTFKIIHFSVNLSIQWEWGGEGFWEGGGMVRGEGRGED